MHMCYLILGMVDVWMRRALRRSGVCLVLFYMAGVRNADAVLVDLQRICKRLLVLAVQMVILFWQFARDLLGMVLFLMAQQGTPHKGVSWF